MTIKKIAISIAAATLPLVAYAQIESGALTTFSANTPAKASEVNANFSALAEAINVLSERVSGIEVETQAAQVAGKCYEFEATETELRTTSNDGYINDRIVRITKQEGRLIFNQGGSGELHPDLERLATLVIDGYGEKDFQPHDNNDVTKDENGVSETFVGRSDGEIDSFTWSQAGGKVAIVFEESGRKRDLNYYVAGETLIGTSTFFYNDPFTGSNGATYDEKHAVQHVIVGTETTCSQ